MSNVHAVRLAPPLHGRERGACCGIIYQSLCVILMLHALTRNALMLTQVLTFAKVELKEALLCALCELKVNQGKFCGSIFGYKHVQLTRWRPLADPHHKLVGCFSQL